MTQLELVPEIRMPNRGTQRRSTKGKTKVQHGLSTDPTYFVWSTMKRRCQSPIARGYHNYGGRGVKVCERWQLFDGFLADMGKRPSPDHSLDRIDPNGDYEPSNCRWDLKKNQQRNTRRSVLTLPMVERARVMRSQGRTYAEIVAEVGGTAGAIKRACLGATWK